MPSNPLGQFLQGVTYPIAAVFFLQRQRLWRWAVLPVLINVAMLVALCAWGWWSVWPMLQTVGEYFEKMSADGDVVRSAIHGLMLIVWFLIFPVVLVIAGAVMLLVGQCVASPFLELLSEHVECAALGVQVPAVSWRRWRRILAASPSASSARALPGQNPKARPPA